MSAYPCSVQIGQNLSKWPGMKWCVSLNISNRQVIESGTAICYRDVNLEEEAGFASFECGPFDDLIVVLRQALIEAAMDSLPDHGAYLEVELPFDPFNR